MSEMKLKKKRVKLHKHAYYVVNSEEIGDKFDENGKRVEIHKRGVVFLCGVPACQRRKQKTFFIDTELNNRLNRKTNGKHETILQEDFMKIIYKEIKEMK